MLKGKTVVLGVTGSIAAYKIANLASMLKKQHADVYVIMTKNATNFIHPTAFESLTGNKCMVDTFDRNFQFNIAHISLAERADICLVAPASANIIAKMAYGIADDMLSTTVMAMTCPVLVSPAMNVNMFNNPVLQDNLRRLERFGKIVIPPDNGYLACGTTGAGKMPSEQTLADYIFREIACEKDLNGKNVLITAGPTREAIDPVRFITNHSTGRMGYAIARNAMLRGANVTLITGPVSLTPPPFVDVVNVSSAAEMFEAVAARYDSQDIIIKSAAVADYTPIMTAEDKIKKADGDMKIELKRTSDILKWLGEHKKDHQVICGFSMETRDVLENSRKKLEKKNADLIAANSIRENGAGFGADTNHLTLIMKDNIIDLPMMTKDDAGAALLDVLITILNNKNKSETPNNTLA